MRVRVTCRSESMAENASRHCARHTCCTSAPELESRCKKVVMRSCRDRDRVRLLVGIGIG